MIYEDTMTEYNKDTSSEYDDMVGYISEDNLPKNLGRFFGDEDDYKPTVRPKGVDPEFSEQWQDIYINFTCFEDYKAFMNKIGEKPVPKLKDMVFTLDKENETNILNFM